MRLWCTESVAYIIVEPFVIYATWKSRSSFWFNLDFWLKIAFIMDFQHTHRRFEGISVPGRSAIPDSVVTILWFIRWFRTADSEVQSLNFRVSVQYANSPLSQLGETRRKRFVIALSVQLICPVIGIIILIVCSRSSKRGLLTQESAEFGVEI